MDRSEPSLVPEWLKSSGSVTTVGTLRPRSSSSSLADEHSRSRLVRNKSSSRNVDQDFGRTSSAHSISPSFSRRSYSINGSSHSLSYSNFGRNNYGRDRDRDTHEYQDKNRKVYGDHREKDNSPRGTFSGFEKDGIRRSQSMYSGRRSEVWPKKPSAGSTVSRANGVLEKDAYGGSMHNAAMEDSSLPLPSEEREEAPEMRRVPSPGPGLSSAFRSSQSTPSAISNGGKWISALAEAPAVVESSGTNILQGQQASLSTSLQHNKGNAAGLNMAEALSLAPLQGQTDSQLSTISQRREELALKQCRQLVPVTPATPKHLALTSLDKVKGGNLGQPQHPSSSTLRSQSVSGGTTKADVLKPGNSGKLQVLKPARERNVVTSAVKDSSISTDSKVVNSPTAVAAAVAGSSLSKRPTSSPVSPTLQHKHVLTRLEKRPTSEGQSRSAFFNDLRKKSGAPSIVSDAQRGQPVNCIATGEIEAAPAPAVTAQESNAGSLNTQNGNEVKEESQGLCAEKHHHRNGRTSFSPNPIISEEEETAFLISLGWVANSGEDSDDSGLTEEEISSFYRGIMKVPSLEHNRVGDIVSARLRSSGLKLES